MNRLFFSKATIAFSVFFLVLIGFLIYRIMESKPTLVYIQPQIVNLGEMWEFDQLQTTAKLINSTSKDMMVSQLVPDCGCTRSSLATSFLPKHSSSPLAISFAAGEVETSTSVHKKIVIQFADGSSIKLPIVAQIKPLIAFSLSELLLGNLKLQEAKIISIKLNNYRGTAWNPQVYQSPDGILVKILDITYSSAHIEITATKKSMIINDLTGEKVVLSTGIKMKPFVSIPLFATRERRLVANPLVINFGIIDAGQAAHKQLSLTETGMGSDFKVLSLQSLKGMVNLKMYYDQSAVIINATLKSKALSAGMLIDDLILVKTNVPEAEEFSIPIIGAVTASQK